MGIAVTVTERVRLEVTTVSRVSQTPCSSRVILEHIVQDHHTTVLHPSLLCFLS